MVCCCCRRGRQSNKKKPSSSPTFLTVSNHSNHHPLSGSTQHLEMNHLLKNLSGSGTRSNNSGGGGSILNGLSSGISSSYEKHTYSHLNVPEVAVGNVHLFEELGCSAYGKVYKGEALLRSGAGDAKLINFFKRLHRLTLINLLFKVTCQSEL